MGIDLRLLCHRLSRSLGRLPVRIQDETVRARIARGFPNFDHVERLHELLLTHGDAALRRAFERGLVEQAIGAEDSHTSECRQP